MNETKTNKDPVRDLQPSGDAKGGWHGHHTGHHKLGSGHQGPSGNDNSGRAGKYWL